MKYYLFLTTKHNKNDDLEDVLNDVYAYTSSKSIAELFKLTRNMNIFTEFIISLDKNERKVLHDKRVGYELIELEVHPDDKSVYNKYENGCICVTKGESMRIKEESLKKINKLSWDFDNNVALLILKNKYIYALNDLKYDLAVNYKMDNLIADKIISGDYINIFIDLFGKFLK